MALSKEKFLHLFLDEFRDNIQAAENQLVVLKNDPENTDALAMLLRTLHTIKGSTRMLEFKQTEELVHGLETVFTGVHEGRLNVDTRVTKFFFLVADYLRFSSESIQESGKENIPNSEILLRACEKIASNEAFDLSTIPEIKTETAAEDSVPVAEHGMEEDALPDTARHETDSTEASHPVSKEGHESFIKVDSEIIDKSISVVNNLTVRHKRLYAVSEQLEELEKNLYMSRGLENPKAARKFITQIGRDVRFLRSHFLDQLFEIDHGIQDIRDAVIGMRMLPVSEILSRFPRMVEETAASLGKSASITISGDSIRLDRTILDKLSDPLIHIVRNAIDHGIEAPQTRKEKGKASNGLIRIDCKSEGNIASVKISDDGAGIDMDAIRKKLIATDPEMEAEVGMMLEEDLIRFLFTPGFSTRTGKTVLSGRGVGLDLVKNNIEAIKGQIHIDSEAGEGTVITLRLPISVSTMDGFFVLSKDNRYFIPASSVTRTMLIDESQLFRIGQKEMFSIGGVSIPLADLSLGIKIEPGKRLSQKLPVLLVRGPGETMGIAVDKIIAYDSLVYQSLPRNLQANTLVQGVVFDQSFDIIPILNMWAVLDNLRSVRIMDTHKRFSATDAAEKKSILVVDDSASTREILLSMLYLEGYDVVGAVDGVDALEKLKNTNFSLVVSDLNMPRMNGLKLLENLKAAPALAEIPLIIITTVDDAGTKARARQLGASAYILKSSFEQDNLLASIEEVLSSSNMEEGGGKSIER